MLAFVVLLLCLEKSVFDQNRLRDFAPVSQDGLICWQATKQFLRVSLWAARPKHRVLVEALRRKDAVLVRCTCPWTCGSARVLQARGGSGTDENRKGEKIVKR